MNNVVLLGSSIIKQWNNIKVNNFNIINRGISRLTTNKLLEFEYLDIYIL